jgi:hypothetical protein
MKSPAEGGWAGKISEPKAARGLLNRLVHIHDRYVRDGHYFGDDIIGDVHTAWLLRVRLYILDVKRGADQSSIAQGDFGYAMANPGDLDHLRRSDSE